MAGQLELKSGQLETLVRNKRQVTLVLDMEQVDLVVAGILATSKNAPTFEELCKDKRLRERYKVVVDAKADIIKQIESQI